jgi:hypothetical protein
MKNKMDKLINLDYVPSPGIKVQANISTSKRFVDRELESQ